MERLGMPLALYSESEHFLNQLERAAQSLQSGLHCPEEDRLKTTAPPASSHFLVQRKTRRKLFNCAPTRPQL
jgi:hypothetical protein